MHLTSRPRGELPELNSLRAIAGVLMLVNHAGVSWFSPQEQGALHLAPLVFLGSFAPVVFFFVTGVGYGIPKDACSSAAPHQFGLVRKVAVLVLADAMMWLGRDRWTGMDFLGFIALSMIVLEPLRGLKRPLAWAAGGLVLVVVVRFAAGPAIVGAHADFTGRAWLGALTGARGFAFVPDSPWYPSVSFSPCPWIAFPLAGFVCGRWASTLAAQRGWRRGLWAGGMLAAAGAGGVATEVLIRHGMVVFRWGTMSFSYFVASWALLAGVTAVVMIAFSLPRSGSTVRRFSLRGLQSLAFVPVHMVVICLLLPFARQEAGLAGFLFLLGLATILAFAGSGLVSRFAAATRTLQDTTIPWLIICAVVLLVGTNRLLLDMGGATLRTLSTSMAQTMLCVGLVLPLPESLRLRRRPVPSVVEPAAPLGRPAECPLAVPLEEPEPG